MDPEVQQLVDTCHSLIEVPSIDGDCAALHEVIERIGAFFAGVPVQIERIERGGYPSIVVTTRKTKTPGCLLHGHVDVVAGDPDQFRPRLSEGRLYGRGAVDMKGFVAVAMHVVRNLALRPDPPDIGLMVNTDEEVGGRSGTKVLVAEGWRPKTLLNGDGGYGDALTFAQKGIVQLEVEASTTPGARNAPWDGENAAELLVSRVARGLETLCPEQPRLDAHANWGSTACVLALHSEPDGVGPPSRARASIRVYWAGEETGEEVIQLARGAFHPLRVSGSVEGERVYLSPEDTELMRLRAIWERRLGRPIDVRADNGSSDAKWFAPLGIPILILRVPGDGAHSGSEWLEVASLRPLYDTLCEYLLQGDERHLRGQKLRIDPAANGPGQPAPRPTGVETGAGLVRE